MSAFRGKSKKSKAASEMNSRDHQEDRSPDPAATVVAMHRDAPPASKADIELEAVAPPLQHNPSQLENHDVKRVGSPLLLPVSLFSLLSPFNILADLVP